MSVTDKFSKAITFISNQDIITAEDWVITLLNYLALLNWDLSKAIISDWDHKFLMNLWKEVFKQLKINLLYLSVYHSQMNSSSEVIN